MYVYLFGPLIRRFSPPTQRRFQKFLSQRRAQFGLTIFFIIFIFSMFAELWSQSVPIFLTRDNVPMGRPKVAGESVGRRTYFPVFKEYSAEEFGITDSFIIDYQALVDADRASGRDVTVLFPFNRWDPFQQTSEVLSPPSDIHWLGTDSLGRDVSARLLYGTRVSLMYGLLYWLFSFLIGIVAGSIQGFFGGYTDFATERFKELVEIIPFLPTIIIVNGLMKSQSIAVTLFVVVAFAWVSISAQIRAQFLSLRKRDFVEAARALGAGRARLIFKHILPNALTPILTLTPFAISGGISILVILDFIGFGLNPPTPSLGELLQQGRVAIATAPWIIWSPTVVLCLMLISINLIGESLRQAFDPRSN